MTLNAWGNFKNLLGKQGCNLETLWIHFWWFFFFFVVVVWVGPDARGDFGVELPSSTTKKIKRTNIWPAFSPGYEYFREQHTYQNILSRASVKCFVSIKMVPKNRKFSTNKTHYFNLKWKTEFYECQIRMGWGPCLFFWKLYRLIGYT